MLLKRILLQKRYILVFGLYLHVFCLFICGWVTYLLSCVAMTCKIGVFSFLVIFQADQVLVLPFQTIKRLLLNIKPKDIGSIIMGSPGEDPKMLADFKDLLDKMFVLDPDKRLTVSQALSHPFITGKWTLLLIFWLQNSYSARYLLIMT